MVKLFFSFLTGRMPTVTLISGPMFSGKTSETIRQIRRHRLSGKKCFLIHYMKDVRYVEDDEPCIVTHDHIKIKAHSVDKDGLMKLLDDPPEGFMEADVVGIDEGQFFNNLNEFCNYLANHMGKDVIVSALTYTYDQKTFPEIRDFVCDDRVYLKAVCHLCKKDGAPFTKRTSHDTDEEVIGGGDMYIALCRECYNR